MLRVSGEVGEVGDRLLIPHEPATSADPDAVIEWQPRPDINTLLWLTLPAGRALRAAAQARVVHGGLQFRSIFLDEAGQPKVGDFGIAPAFADVCGRELRARICCTPGAGTEADGVVDSGTWELLRPGEIRPHGWIAPLFAHELFEQQLPLNLQADQFALGVVLFAVATGRHPYGASWSDPLLNLYFQIEPYALAEVRADWQEAFAHERAGVAASTDQPILTWAELVLGLLASEPEQRQSVAGQAAEACAALAPEEWAGLTAAIAAGRQLLEQGEALDFLEKLAPWREHPAWPEPGRERLAAWIGAIDAQKDSLRARKAREHRLAAGREAAELYDLAAARVHAEALMADADAEEDVRQGAEALLKLCQEQEQFIESGADALAMAYLDAAQEALAAERLDDAREVLRGIMQDPGMSPLRAAQARQMLGDVELAAQRLERQTAELEAAVAEEQAFELASAEQRLALLLQEEQPAESVARRAVALLEQVRTRLRQRVEWRAALDDGLAAWEQSDLPAIEQRLQHVPENTGDPQVDPQRARLAQAAARLRQALEQQAEAERQLAENQPVLAARCATAAAAVGELPESLSAVLQELTARCQKAIEQQRLATLAVAREALNAAQAAFDAGDIAASRRRLDEEVLPVAELPADQLAQAQRLSAECARAAQLLDQFTAARAELVQEHFDAAAACLDRVAADGLPGVLVAQKQQLADEIAAAQAAFVQRQRDELGQQLEQAAAALAAGRLRPAGAILRTVERSAYLTDELRARGAELRAKIDLQRRGRKSPWPLAAGGGGGGAGLRDVGGGC